MTDQEIVDARLLYQAAPALIPLIDRLHDMAYQRLLDNFRDRGEDSLGMIAECAAYRNILSEIKYRISNLEQHYKEKE